MLSQIPYSLFLSDQTAPRRNPTEAQRAIVLNEVYANIRFHMRLELLRHNEYVVVDRFTEKPVLALSVGVGKHGQCQYTHSGETWDADWAVAVWHHVPSVVMKFLAPELRQQAAPEACGVHGLWLALSNIIVSYPAVTVVLMAMALGAGYALCNFLHMVTR